MIRPLEWMNRFRFLLSRCTADKWKISQDCDWRRSTSGGLRLTGRRQKCRFAKATSRSTLQPRTLFLPYPLSLPFLHLLTNFVVIHFPSFSSLPRQHALHGSSSQFDTSVGIISRQQIRYWTVLRWCCCRSWPGGVDRWTTQTSEHHLQRDHSLVTRPSHSNSDHHPPVSADCHTTSWRHASRGRPYTA